MGPEDRTQELLGASGGALPSGLTSPYFNHLSGISFGEKKKVSLEPNKKFETHWCSKFFVIVAASSFSTPLSSLPSSPNSPESVKF